MLKTHLNNKEATLLSLYESTSSSGHSTQKGTPRELFIRQFLSEHLNSNVAIGSGEIIDASSRAGESRNQHDIVIYKKNYPKINFGEGVDAFLIESVIATIEVKSTLTEEGICQAVKAASVVKKCKKHLSNLYLGSQDHYLPFNFVVAYKGPAKMQTVHDWILNGHDQNNVPLPEWNRENRLSTRGTALDGVFILKTGFVTLNNTSISINRGNESGIHLICDTEEHTLLYLFLRLLVTCSNLDFPPLDPIPYMQTANFPIPTII